MDDGLARKVLTVLDIEKIDLGAWWRRRRTTSWPILRGGDAASSYSKNEQTKKEIEIMPVHF
jgi:hypothetical protein